MPPDTVITVFLVVWNICDDARVSAVQTAFQWDSSWTLLGSAWDCQTNQVALPPQNPGGRAAGTVTTAFDCAMGEYVVVVGRLFLRTGPAGCLYQVEPASTLGTHVVDCNGRMSQLDFDRHYETMLRLGGICVRDQTGNGCYDPWPVEATTWGRIRASC